MFPKEFGIYEDEHEYAFESDGFQITHGSAVDVERILKNFASRLHIISVEEDDLLLNVAAKYCGGGDGGTLCKIQMVEMKICLEPKFEPIFQRLHSLFIFCCHTNCTTFPNVNFDSLIELEIIGSTGCIAILRHTFPSLDRFNFSNSSVDAEENGD